MDSLKPEGLKHHFSSLDRPWQMEETIPFIQWLQDNGAQISPKIAIKDYSDEGAGLGVVALEAVKVKLSIFYKQGRVLPSQKDEILFKIPRSCLLTKSSSKHRAEIKKACKGATGWIPLMWAIILERLDGEESFWYPYFSTYFI
jgi:SET domain-containing protein 6